ncbi:DUF3311 domain-containing protein [Metabacillus sp. GX 13764]|uniref:DUF3311 domain-containing protein n=1 Tax=Metabacillus kandeliae TaxID=2900151 RepID=UPI001E615062|nr:DUF3311 domain-containing protein [Metabacillus kandeliae]MCD7035577.1 DUF3311 domain-containing protein [Metabacillus kandeliae]
MKSLYMLALLPFIGLLGGLSFANRVEPYVLGMPFLIFWIILWVVLTSLIMGTIYFFDPVNKEESE